MVNNPLTDWWGNLALDYGDLTEMAWKYTNNIFAAVTNQPVGPCYVLFVCGEDEQEKAKIWLKSFNEKMNERKITGYSIGLIRGNDAENRKMEGFQGGVGYL
jgi:hypothetical protein